MEVKHKHKEGVQLFINKELELEVRAIKNDDGSISLNAEDSAKGLGWTRVATSGNTVIRWDRVNKYISEFGSYPQVGTNDYIPESLFYLLAMKANNKVAQEFQKWLAVDVIPSIRRTGSYQSQQKAIEGLNNIITDMQGTIEEYKSMCKITCSTKRNYTDYIKKALGINKANSEFERVKARVFLVLGVTKWEDIDFETSKNILSVIDESIRVAKRERPYKQMSYFD